MLTVRKAARNIFLQYTETMLTVQNKVMLLCHSELDHIQTEIRRLKAHKFIL